MRPLRAAYGPSSPLGSGTLHRAWRSSSRAPWAPRTGEAMLETTCQPAASTPAMATAVAGVGAAGWQVVASIVSPVLGARGARELLLHARWRLPELGGENGT